GWIKDSTLIRLRQAQLQENRVNSIFEIKQEELQHTNVKDNLAFDILNRMTAHGFSIETPNPQEWTIKGPGPTIEKTIREIREDKNGHLKADHRFLTETKKLYKSINAYRYHLFYIAQIIDIRTMRPITWNMIK